MKLKFLMDAFRATFVKKTDGRQKRTTLLIGLSIITAQAFAQIPTANINGTVNDNNGEPIIGATIQEKGGSHGAVTDFDGHFQLETGIPSTIVISYIGYESKEISITGNEKNLHIILDESAKALDELVVIGYGTVRKRDLTGAIASVRADEMSLSRSSLEQALVGHTPGVQIKQTSGAPGASTTIRIRGVNSVYSGAEPLYVIDGFPASDNYINPEDVASIEFLKDAASAAIYGSRAAGGVVLITTKRGSAGKAKVEYGFQYSRQSVLRKIEMMNAAEFRQLHIDGQNNNYFDQLRMDGIISGSIDDMLRQMEEHANDDNDTRIANGASQYMLLCPDVLNSEYDTDWQDALFNPAGMARHNFNVTGGKEGFRYMFSLGYLDQDGIIAPGNHKRLNGRLNMDMDITKRFSIAVNTSMRYVNERTVKSDGLAFNDGVVLNALGGLPQYKIYEDDGSYSVGIGQANSKAYGTFAFENPLALAQYIQQYYKRSRNEFNTEMRYKVMDGLNAKIHGGFVVNDQIFRYYRPAGEVGSTNYAPGDFENLARSQNDRDFNTEWLLEATLDYNKTFADKHTINAIAGYAMQTKIYDNIDANGKNYDSDRIPELSGAGGELGDTDATTDRAAWSLMSYFGRAIYSFDNRYNVSLSMRTDGCSRFGSNSRWGVFPSISGGWTLSNEEFFSPAADIVSLAKLRASWGVSGNNNIGNYRHIANIANTHYIFGNEVANAYYPAGFTDQELSWETTRQTNIGIDLGFFRNRLTLSGNYYYSVTRDLLYQMTTTAFTGSTSYWTNMEDGRVYNQGFDLQADGAIISGKNWKWNMGFNISLNRNHVEGLQDEVIEKAQRSQITHITRNGHPIGSYYGMVSSGLITREDYENILIDKQHQGEEGYELTGPAVNNYNEVFIGDVKWKDVNGDGKITEDDRDIIGNNYPDFTFGLHTSVNYKGLSLSATFDGQYGADVINFSKYYICNMEGSVNTMTVGNSRYRNEQNPGNGLYYRANRQAKNLNTKFSTYYVEDASFFRCTNITLGYDIPENKVFDALNISRLNVYGSVDNLFMLTKYLGYNPDVDYNGASNLTPGVDFGTYPLSRTFSLGLKLTFN